jgi:hypothetical protein
MEVLETVEEVSGSVVRVCCIEECIMLNELILYKTIGPMLTAELWPYRGCRSLYF